VARIGRRFGRERQARREVERAALLHRLTAIGLALFHRARRRHQRAPRFTVLTTARVVASRIGRLRRKQESFPGDIEWRAPLQHRITPHSSAPRFAVLTTARVVASRIGRLRRKQESFPGDIEWRAPHRITPRSSAPLHWSALERAGRRRPRRARRRRVSICGYRRIAVFRRNDSAERARTRRTPRCRFARHLSHRIAHRQNVIC
jgi:hypothetical protein